MLDFFTQFDAMPGSDAPIDIRAATTRDPPDWFLEALGSVASDSGERVSPQTAMTHGPVWQAINILAGDIGQLPWHKMVRSGDETRKDRTHRAELLINDGPNFYQTPSVWKETMMTFALGWGNGISWYRDDQLLPLDPSVTHYEEVDGSIFITTIFNGKREEIPYRDCFHIRGLTSNGFWGISAVKTLKNSIGHGLALEKHGNAVFKNGASIPGVVTHPRTMTLDARKNFRNEWREHHAGGRNAGNVAILWEGMGYTPVAAMSNRDAQFIEDEKLDPVRIARIFNIPPFKLGALENSSVRANLEEQNRDYFNTSLSRWTNRFTEEANRKLLSTFERKSYKHFFRWFPEGFLRGDIKSRYEAYSTGKTAKFLTTNEIRDKEDMDRIDGGDVLENPAIDTSESMREQQDAAKELIENQVRAMLSNETSRLQRGAKGAADFGRVAAKFYSEYQKFAHSYLESACKMAQSVGLACDWRVAVVVHANFINEQLQLAIEGVTTKDDLLSRVEEFRECISSCAGTVVDSILGDNQDG